MSLSPSNDRDTSLQATGKYDSQVLKNSGSGQANQSQDQLLPAPMPDPKSKTHESGNISKQKSSFLPDINQPKFPMQNLPEQLDYDSSFTGNRVHPSSLAAPTRNLDQGYSTGAEPPGPLEIQKNESLKLLNQRSNSKKSLDKDSLTPHSIDSSQFFQTPSKNPRNDDEKFKDGYRRDKTDLDIASFYSSMDSSKAKAEDNMRDYIKNFSIHLSLPTVYVYQAKIYHRSPVYNICLVRYICKQHRDLKQQVTTHYLKGKLEKDRALEDIYADKDQSLMLRVNLRDHQAIKMVDEIAINSMQGIIDLNNDGSLFAFFMQDQRKIMICSIENNRVNQFIAKLRRRQQGKQVKGFYLEFSTGKIDLRFVQKLEFDKNNRFLIGYGEHKVFFLNLMTQETQIHAVSSRKFVKICSVNFESSSDQHFKCFVACERKGVKQICTFDLFEDLKLRELNNKIHHGQKLKSEISINYQNDLDPDYKVMIDSKCRQIVLANGNENCLVEQDGAFHTQRLIGEKMHDKNVLMFKRDLESGGFFIICRKQFDRFVRIYHTNKPDFKFRFERVVEAKLIISLDFHIQQVIDENGITKKEMRLIQMEDDHFLIDRVDFREVSSYDKVSYVDKEYQYFTLSQISAFSFSWPYICFSGIKNFVCIISSFDKERMHRIEVAQDGQVVTICKTFITETDDMFILLSEGDTYKLYLIDLDEFEAHQKRGDKLALKPRLMMQYSHDSVGNLPIDQIHIRGSSRKQMVDINEKLQVFLLHGQKIFSWIKLDESTEEPEEFQRLKFVSTCSSFLYPKENNKFIFLKHLRNESGELMCQDIIEVKCNFSTYSMDIVYEEMSKNVRVKCIKYDTTQNRVMILTKSKGIRNGTFEVIYDLKIFDMDTKTSIIDISLTNQDRIGRIKTGLFTLIDGHMYFSNDLIKIRYDLIEGQRVQNMLTEEQIFDNYDDCFQLDTDQLVRSRTPLVSLTGNRFAFIISDQTKKSPLEVFIIPFLHEKRIELGKDYQKNIFYTAIETPIEQEEVYLNELMISKRKNLELNIKNIINYDKINNMSVKKRKKSVIEQSLDLGLSGVKMGGSGIANLGTQGLQQITGNKKPSTMRPKIQKDQFTSIVAFDQDQQKYKVYNQKGILINEIDFSDKVENYGYPIATSSNGQIFLFKKTDEQLEDEMLEGQFLDPQLQSLNDSQKTEHNLNEEFLTIHVIQMTVYGMVWVKSINLKESILGYISASSGNHQDVLDFIALNQWIKDPCYEKMRNTLEIKCQINNNKDVLVEIKDKNAFTYQTGQKLYRPVFYWEAAQKIQEEEASMLDITKIKSLNPIQQQEAKVDTFVFQPDEPCLVKMVMNNEFIFKWEIKNVYYFDLGRKINDTNGKKLSLSIDPRDQFSFTKNIVCGSNPYEIVIIIQNTQINTETVLTWNLKKNIQEEAYEMKEEYIVIWDMNGSPFIITNESVYFTNKRCMITAYEIKGLVSQMLTEAPQTTFDHTRGYKIDFKNHNWVLLKDCLSLSFSYLTFVIQDKIENQDPCLDANVFDLTPYNYIFNKNTAFIQGDFVSKDHQMLADVLQKISNINLDHLQILNYTQDVYQYAEDDEGDPQKNSALHKAVLSGNQRSTDLLLEWLSQLNYNSSRNYVSVFEQIVEQKGFVNYFNKLSVQTEIMKKKLILRSKDCLNSTIVKMTSSPCEYIDEEFFQTNMQEKEEYQSHPVQIEALRVQWILNHPAGKGFLSKILDEGDLSLYQIRTLQMIIEFLFKEYKKLIWFLVFPLYVFSQVTFEMLLNSNDAYLSNMYKHKLVNGTIIPDYKAEEYKQEDKVIREKLIAYATINFFAMIIQLIQMLALFKSSGFSYFKKIYGILDSLYIFFTFNIYIKIFETYEREREETDFIQKTKMFRQVAVFATLTLYFKATYFFSLIDAAAPLVDIIFKVITDIKWFIGILFFYMLALGKCFSLLGTNQLEFDNLSEEEIDSIGYLAPGEEVARTKKNFNRVWFVAQFALGGPDGMDAFEVGDATMYYQLSALYAFACVIVVLHLLNMLIAIMGNTFAERTEVGDLIMTKDHLRFVMDNWELRKIAFDLPQIKYIICAFAAEDEEGEGVLGEIKDELSKMNGDLKRILMESQGIIKDTHMVVSANNRRDGHETKCQEDEQILHNSAKMD